MRGPTFGVVDHRDETSGPKDKANDRVASPARLAKAFPRS